MRCRDVSRAIAAPNGAISEAEIEAHLVACPRCASQARAALRLDRLWEQTRAEAPSASSWESAWARIDRELATPEPIAEVPIAPTRSVVARVPIRLALGLGLAAAAALLLALNLPAPGPKARVAGGGPVYGSLEVPVGHTVLYHVDSAEHRVIQVSELAPGSEDDLTFFGQSEVGLDAVDYFALFGWFEAIPSLMASAPSGEGPSPSPFDPIP